MKIADYVSKYLKESYDEPKGIENEDEAKKAIEDLKDFFEMGEDEDNEFGDDLDKMLMSMDSGEDVDDDLDFDELDFDEGKDSKKDCPECKTTEEGKYCADCGVKNEGSKKEGAKEEGKDWEDMTDEEQKSQERHSVKEEGDSFSDMVKDGGHSDGYGKSGSFTHPDVPGIEFDSEGYDPEGKHISWWLSLDDGYVPKRKGMSEKSVMEKKLEDYREGKKNKKGFKPRGVVDTGDSSDGE